MELINKSLWRNKSTASLQTTRTFSNSGTNKLRFTANKQSNWAPKTCISRHSPKNDDLQHILSRSIPISANTTQSTPGQPKPNNAQNKYYNNDTRDNLCIRALISSIELPTYLCHPHPEPPIQLVDHCRLVSGVVRMRLWRGSGSMSWNATQNIWTWPTTADRPITNNGSWCGMISCPPGSEWFC